MKNFEVVKRVWETTCSEYKYSFGVEEEKEINRWLNHEFIVPEGYYITLDLMKKVVQQEYNFYSDENVSFPRKDRPDTEAYLNAIIEEFIQDYLWHGDREVVNETIDDWEDYIVNDEE